MSLACRRRSVTSSKIDPIQSTSPHRSSVTLLTCRRSSLIVVTHSPLIEDLSSIVTTSASASAFRPFPAPVQWCSLKVFHFTNFSLFFSLTLSQSLTFSFSLSEITEMKWMRVFLSLYSLTLTLSDSFELWLAEILTLWGSFFGQCLGPSRR